MRKRIVIKQTQDTAAGAKVAEVVRCCTKSSDVGRSRPKINSLITYTAGQTEVTVFLHLHCSLDKLLLLSYIDANDAKLVP